MTNNAKGLLITSVGVLVMSLESLFIKLTTISPFLFSFYIGIFMFVATSGTIVFKQRDIIKKFEKNSLKYTIICASLMAVSNILFVSAIKNTYVANVVIILSISPLLASLFNFIFYGKKPSKNIYVASLFIFIGLYIIFKDQISLGSLAGNIYALLCAILFSISFVFLERHKDLNRVVLTAISGLMTSVLCFLFISSLIIDVRTLLILMAMGLLVTPISRVMIGNGTKYINASEVSLLMIIETILAPLWVWMFLNEIPTNQTFMGGSIILITLILNSLYKLKK